MQIIDPKTEQTQGNFEDIHYEAPAIIYEGMVSTRAGSEPVGVEGDEEAAGVDLFGD